MKSVLFRKITSLVLSGILVAAVLTGCSGSSSTSGGSNASKTSEDIRVGAIYPLTGDVAAIGQNIKKGIDFAVEEINEKGGIMGRKLNIIYGDSHGDPKAGMSETERLVTRENAAALIGAYQSAVTEVVSQTAERYQTPLITAISTADVLTTRGYKYFFRQAPTNMMYLRDMIQFLTDVNKEYKTDIKNIGIIADNTLLGQETLKWAKYWAEKANLSVGAEILYTKGAADLTSEVLALKKANLDALVVDSYISDAILLTKTIHEQGFKPKVMVGKATGFIDPTFIKNVGEFANGITTIVEWNPDLTKGGKVNERFKAKFGIDMNGHSAEAYTAVWTLKTAIESAGSTDKNKIRDALEKVEIKSSFPGGEEIILPYDVIKFEDMTWDGVNHKNTNTGTKLGIAQIQDGKYNTVWPFDVSKNKVNIPAFK